ncbi:MAG: DNA alkylation repair protein [Candidatus Nomurabacteria bacterium]|jgi:3-methyladenine DNA glycosylase AlkD|nr:DNA alkylation repair protein [Candidatus Nomurabacteria bacterium]
MIDLNKLRSKLAKLAHGNNKYATGNKRIVNTKQTLIGVRMPDLRIVAKELSRGMTFAEIQEFLRLLDKENYEEIMISGMIIGYAKLSNMQKIELFREYLKLVDSWAQIDSITNRKMNTDEWWEFAMECLKSPDEFVVRFGVIVMMDNFLNIECISQVLTAMRHTKHEGYYVKMAVAWLYAEAAIKFYEETLAELERTEIDHWTRRKALQKMLESYRFSDAQKTEIREARKS